MIPEPWRREPAAVRREEWMWVGAWAVLMVLVCFVPIWFGYALAADGWTFTGLHAGALNDYQSYMAWIRQAEDGHLLFVDKFTSEPHRRVIFHPLFWLIGSLARWTSAPVIGVWYLFQGLGVALLVLAIYRFAAEFTDSPATRVLALVLATTSAGLGWLFPGADQPSVVQRPIDLWQEEAFGLRAICSSFFTLTLALALMLLVAVSMLRYFRSGRLRHAAAAGAIALLLATVHPYDLVTLYAVLGVWTLDAGRRRWPGMIVLVALSAPYLLYGFLAIRLDPVLSRIVWVMEMPPVSAYAIGWGLPLALSVLGLLLPTVWRENRHVRLLLAWLAVQLLLLLVPLEFRRKLNLGLHVILSLLAAMTIRTLAAWMTARVVEDSRRRTVAGAAVALPLVALMAVGSFHLLLFQLRDRTFGRFLPVELVEALRELDERSGEEDVVLAGPALAGFVPGWAGATSFWGHWAQTVDIEGKVDLARRLLAPDGAIDPDAAARALAGHRIRWVVLDAASAAMGAGAGQPSIAPAAGGEPWPLPVERLPVAPFTRPVFENARAVILEVLPELLQPSPSASPAA